MLVSEEENPEHITPSTQLKLYLTKWYEAHALLEATALAVD
ncbi:31079_t:CDS:2 [Gigaspora margarita]|uniref:31079_t:CDS:1 n=1 Tax=Gigaspora margarita TaxID=4874 RepID=A0ABN7V031_GIGMA|nr:31079_t:CDS:2 [Gigaspora margarita]